MPVGAALFGADGGLVHANPVLADLGGRPGGSRGALAELVDEAERDLVEERIEQTLTGARQHVRVPAVGVARGVVGAELGRCGPTSRPPSAGPRGRSTAWCALPGVQLPRPPVPPLHRAGRGARGAVGLLLTAAPDGHLAHRNGGRARGARGAGPRRRLPPGGGAGGRDLEFPARSSSPRCSPPRAAGRVS